MQTLRGVFPPSNPKPPKRDFLKENVKNLKEMQKNRALMTGIVHTNAKTKNSTTVLKKQSITNLHLQQSSNRNDQNKFKTVVPPIHLKREPSLKSIKSVQSEGNIELSPTPSSAASHKTIDKSSQTDNVDDEMFLKDVIIRYPSTSASTTKDDTNSEQYYKNYLEKEHVHKLNEFLTNGSVSKKNSTGEHPRFDWKEMKDNLSKGDYCSDTNKNNEIRVKSTEQLVIKSPQLVDKSDDSKLNIPPTHKMGQIPKYLKQRKEKLAEMEQNLPDPDCPEGHVLLSDKDRKDALAMAMKKYKDLIDELNMMPITTETIKLRRRKIEIEHELNKLDNTIKIFSKSKVYVKLDE